MNSIAYTPEPGSPADRVLDLLARNPQEEYTSSDLALKFQVPKKTWDTLLAEPVAKGLIHREKTAADPNGWWCAGAGLRAWVAQRNGAAAPPAPASSQRAKTEGPKARAPLAVPSVDDLVVEEGAAITTPQFGRAGTSKWVPILALLTKPNTSVALPLACRNPLVAYLRIAKLAGSLRGTFVVGLDAKDPSKCRVLRTA